MIIPLLLILQLAIGHDEIIENEMNWVLESLEQKSDSCMLNVMAKYYIPYQEIIPAHDVKERALVSKILAVELTKCLFDGPYMPELDERCNATEWNEENLQNCVGSLAQNNVIWTTFNGYLGQMDSLVHERSEKIDNLRILKEYKLIISSLGEHMDNILTERIEREFEFADILNTWHLEHEQTHLDLVQNLKSQIEELRAFNKLQQEIQQEERIRLSKSSRFRLPVLIVALLLLTMTALVQLVGGVDRTQVELALFLRMIAFGVGAGLATVLRHELSKYFTKLDPENIT
ncbi:uncharacterized protein C5L36_0C00220 [Pichia kudriavzevii]|uniref:Karyogamy protein 5 n=1 Tax=Pichia kudriavzevii TaxID=4909 RepID=A0A2U9R415_PICKU|nr:uncharacterized protein C5L36_0C00220 [Pichia kudriavzevii]AWU76077.1 hypothetical protein C5L36_0C00220 [Pichia kudriavzevii]